MPDPTFVAGSLGTVTINAQNFSAIGNVTRLAKNRTVNGKKTFGNRYGFATGGQRDVNFSASGFISAEQAAALDAAYETDAAVAFSLQVGVAAAASDAGVHTGFCVIGNLTIEANADGDWAWSLDAQSSGTVTYTPVSESSSSSSS